MLHARAVRLVLLGLCVLTLAVSVADLARVRQRLPPPSPAGDAEWQVALPDVRDVPGRTLVAMVTVTNGNREASLRVTAALAGAVDAVDLPPTGSGELVVVADASAALRDPVVRLSGTHADWRVDSGSVSNARGFSRGLINLTMVPRREAVGRAPAWAWILTAAAAIALWVAAPRPPGRVRRWLLAAAAFFLLLFLASLLSGVVTPYRVVLEPRTYALGVLVMCAAFVPIRAPAGARSRRIAVAVVAGASALCGFAFYSSVMLQELSRFGGNYSGFLHITREVAERAPFLDDRPDLSAGLLLTDGGYDGQFMYLMAFDPLLRAFPAEPERYREVVDFPPYRYGRIGYSALTAAAAGGEAERFPAAMMWLVLAGHLGLGLGLVAIARHAGAPPWLGALYLLIPGYMASLAFGLPESLAACGLVAGLYFWLTGRPWPAAIAFSLSLLVRETGLVLVAATCLLIGGYATRRRVAWLTLALLPVIVWRLYAGVVFFPDFGWMAFAPSPGDLAPPFSGFAALYGAVWNGSHPASEARAAIVYPLLLSAALGIAVATWRRTRHGLAAAAVAYGVLAVSLTYDKIWMHVPSGERGTSELFLMLLLVSMLSWRERRGIAPALVALGIALGVYTFFLSPEAAAARAGLLLVR